MAKPMFTLYFVDLNVEKKNQLVKGVELKLYKGILRVQKPQKRLQKTTEVEL